MGRPLMRELERVVLLRKSWTRKWMEHIDNMDELRKGIYLRSYGQRDPVVEYRIEGFDMFDEMVESIREDTTRMLLNDGAANQRSSPSASRWQSPPARRVPGDGPPGQRQPMTTGAGDKIGRNDPCPCGSGLKWKKCTCAQYHPDGVPHDEN